MRTRHAQLSFYTEAELEAIRSRSWDRPETKDARNTAPASVHTPAEIEEMRERAAAQAAAE